MKFDVAIVGGGPCGAIAGKCAAMHGAKTVIIEEHPAIGEPVQCAGIISTRAAAACELDRGDFLIKTVRGAFINAPQHRLKIDGHSEKAWIVDRRIFDRELVDRALDAGCALLLRSKVIDAFCGRLDLRISGEREVVEADVIIAADGVSRKITRSYLGDFPLPKIIPGIQAEVSCEFEDPEFVELFLGEAVAPGFFAWMIPTEEGFGRVGLCVADGSGRSPLGYLQKLINEHPSIKGSVTDFVLGGIPIGMAKRTVADGFMAVGDGAGQVKPTTGGGIYTGAVCAKIAGIVAAEAALEGDTGYQRLFRYEREWRKSIGRELAIGFAFHRWFSRLDDHTVSQLLESLSDPMIKEMIEEFGDMDRPSILLKKLAHLPKMKAAGFFLALVKSF